MGLEEIASSTGANIPRSKFMKSTQANDHSNPQQGTGAKKAIMQDNDRQNKTNSSPVTSRRNASHASGHVEDKRKLFVGGLPTDITDPEFKEFFSKFGELREAVVMFDRDTGRSRGFGFVTYVDPEVSQSLLRMGNHGNGIGRLVMRGKTCEVKAAAPRGQAPARGGKSSRSYRGGRNQHQPQGQQVPSFGQNEQFPVYLPNDNYNVPFAQGIYSTVPNFPGYTPPVYHHAMPPPSHAQPHTLYNGSIPLNVDRGPGDGGVVGTPYFFSPPQTVSPPDRFPVPNTFPHTTQIPAHYQQQGGAFIPYIPEQAKVTIPAMEMNSGAEHAEPGNQTIEQMNNTDAEVIDIEKE